MLRTNMSAPGPDTAAAVASPRHRWWTGRFAIGVFAVIALLIVTLLVCEMLGWRFLREPMQRRLASTLGVEVRIDAPFELHLLRPPQLSVAGLRVGAPAESGAPFLVDARDALLQWRWGDLWAYRQGDPLRVKRLEARSVEAHVKRLDVDRASWKFSKAQSGDPPAALPRFDILKLSEGLIHVDDKLLQLVLEVQMRLNERARAEGAPVTPWRLARATAAVSDDLAFGFAPPAGGEIVPALHNALMTVAQSDVAGFSLDARGSYRGMPATGSLRAPSLMPLLSQQDEQVPVMVVARASVGSTRMHYDGASVDLAGRGLAGDFRLSGPSLAAVGEPFGVTLPTTGPFSLHGHIRRPDAVWQVRIDEAEIGRSQLAGDFRYDPQGRVPVLTGRVDGKRLALADLGPAVGTASRPGAKPAPGADAGPRRVIPDKRFDLPSLRAMNADVAIALDELDLNTSTLEPFRPLRTRVLLKDGVLRLEDIDARTAGGSVNGSTSLDATVSPARWQADLAWKNVDLAGWLAGARKSDSDVTARSTGKKLQRERAAARGGKAPVTAYLTGELRGALKLTGYGNSTAQILGSADGQLQASVHDGTISHLAVEVMGLDVAQALGMLVKGDESLPLSCAVVAIDAQRGVLRPKVALFDTRDSTLSFDGDLSLASERLDLRGSVRPKDFTFLSLRTPLKIQGTFGAPAVSLEPAPLAGRVAAGAARARINPVAAILPFLDPGDGKAPNGCRRLADRMAAADAKK